MNPLLSVSRRFIVTFWIPLLWLSSCALPQEPKPQYGTLSVILPGEEEGRMTFQEYARSLSFYLNGLGPGTLAEQKLKPGQNLLSIAPGAWSLRLTVKNKEGEEVGSDTQDAVILERATAHVSFTIMLENPDPETYLITFVHQGEDTGAEPKTLKIPWKDANRTPTMKSLGLQLPAPPARSDAFFVGWHTAEGDEFTENTEVSEDLTLYAQWSEKPLVPRITITVQPADHTVVTAGNITGSLSITATVTEDAELGYQWYSAAAASNEAGTVIEGAVSQSLTIPTNLTMGEHYYFCEITATGGSNPIRSNVAKVTVQEAAAVPLIAITVQPRENTVVTVGNITGSLSMTATVTEGAELGYQWYSAAAASNEAGTVIEGAVSPSLTFPTNLTMGKHYYFCEITATGGANPVRSNVATVRVQEAAVVPLIAITVQPRENTVVTVGNITGSLSITATVTEGAELGYQWYSAAHASNVGGSIIEGATKASLTIPTNLTMGEYYYFCEITASGGANPVRSNVAKVRVTNFEIGVIIELNEEPELVEQTAEALANTDRTFTAGSGWTAYQWYLDGVSLAGATTENYTFNQPAGIYNLTVVVTDGAGDNYSGSCLVTVE